MFEDIYYRFYLVNYSKEVTKNMNADALQLKKSLKVESEPLPNKIKVSPCHSSLKKFPSAENIVFNVSSCPKSNFYKCSKSLDSTYEKKGDAQSCGCPRILICDDDPFQHLYYFNILSKLKEEGTIGENFESSFHFSGESMIQELQKVRKCGCDKPRLIISDFDIGENKNIGVSTCIEARKTGYNGAILMRSANSKEELLRDCPELNRAIESGNITKLISKDDFVHTKSLIQEFLI